MANFRKGDYVQCVDGARQEGNVLTVGKIYQVTEIDRFGYVCVDGVDYPWSDKRFRLVPNSDVRVKFGDVWAKLNNVEVVEVISFFVGANVKWVSALHIEGAKKGMAFHSTQEDFEKEFPIFVRANVCEWTEDENGDFRTSCKNKFSLFDGTFQHSKMEFCPACAKPIREQLNPELQKKYSPIRVPVTTIR